MMCQQGLQPTFCTVFSAPYLTLSNLAYTRFYGGPQITKNKPCFTNDDSLRRMLYLASQRITKSWRTRCQNWDLALSQLEILFSGRAVG